MKRRILFLLLVVCASGFLLVSAADAINPLQNLNAVGSAAEYNTGQTATVENLAASIINTFLSILGIIFLAYLIYGGFTWMRAQGNDDEVNNAKKIITQAVIGLIIILAAYAISYFVASRLEKATFGTRSLGLGESASPSYRSSSVPY